MRVCVVGCGAVGSLFAANLANLDDVEVWAYDLDNAHIEAINMNGLQLTGAGEVVGRPRATSDASELPACDFGIVATKAMHTDAAIAATAHAFAGGAVATVQNGVGNEETIAPYVHRVIRGTTFPAGKILAPGIVQWDVKGDTTLGPFEPKPAETGRGEARRPYALSFTLEMANLLNHTNSGPIIGNITSPLFGRANQPAGGGGFGGFSEAANNRRFEFQTRFTF